MSYSLAFILLELSRCALSMYMSVMSNDRKGNALGLDPLIL
jgi:hypothetical protein